MKTFLRQYFTFNARDQRAIFLLLFLLSLILFVRVFFVYIEPGIRKTPSELIQRMSNQSDFREAGDGTEKDLSETELPYDFKRKFEPKREDNLLPFNPNLYTPIDWVKAGLSPRQAEVVCAFLKKNPAQSVSDLNKIKYIPERIKRNITPLLIFPSTEKENRSLIEVINTDADPINITNDLPDEPIHKVELNACNWYSLMQTGLCDTATAAKIKKYRTALGGFVHTGQLFEIYEVDSHIIKGLIPVLEIDPSQVQLINVNKANSTELARHPYLSKSVALAIANYRAVHGPFKKVSDIKNCLAVSQQTYEKIKPYLKLED